MTEYSSATCRPCWQLVRPLLRWLFILLLSGWANSSVLSLPGAPGGPLGQWTQLLIETDGPMTLSQARSAYLGGQYLPVDSAMMSLGIGSTPIWLRLEVENTLPDPAPYRLVTGMTWIDQFDIYLVHQGRVLKQWQLGDSLESDNRLLAAQGYATELLFPQGASELYIRAESPDPMAVSVQLFDQSLASHEGKLVHYHYGFLYGYILALVAYNCILYAGSRKRSHLYYSIYLTSFIALNLAYTGHGLDWFWPGAFEFQQYIIFVLMVLFSALGLRFASRFLALEEHSPKSVRIGRLFTWGAFALSGITILADAQVAAAWVAFTFVTLYTLIMVGLGFLTVINGLNEGRYFLLASLAGMIGIAVTALAVWGLIPLTYFTFHGAEIGILFEATFFALALAQKVRRQELATDQAELRARTDPLTGVNNRRAFLEQAQLRWKDAIHTEEPISLIMMDIDKFKSVNDQYGHAAGDSVLVEVAKLLRHACRANDLLCRWGGEEFLICLPGTALPEAIHISERLREQIASKNIIAVDGKVNLTVSIGVAQHRKGLRIEDIIDEADKWLYLAKEQGRNRVLSEQAPELKQA